MIILDAYAELALLKGETAGPQVPDLLRGDHDARLTSVGVAEVNDQLVRLCGANEDGAALDIAQLGLADAQIIDAATALRAGLLRAVSASPRSPQAAVRQQARLSQRPHRVWFHRPHSAPKPHSTPASERQYGYYTVDGGGGAGSNVCGTPSADALIAARE